MDGRLVPVPFLEIWVRLASATAANDSDLVVPFLRAGRYAYCEIDDAEVQLVLENRAVPSGRACSHGTLAEGGELRLELEERGSR